MNDGYLQGFIEKCSESGIDPEELIKVAALPNVRRLFGAVVPEVARPRVSGKTSRFMREALEGVAPRVRNRVPTRFGLPIPPRALPVREIPEEVVGRRSLLGRALRMPAWAAVPLGVGAYGLGSKAYHGIESQFGRSPQELELLRRLRAAGSSGEDLGEAIEGLNLQRRMGYAMDTPYGGFYRDPLLGDSSGIQRLFQDPRR
jgi:hypothetical protein